MENLTITREDAREGNVIGEGAATMKVLKVWPRKGIAAVQRFSVSEGRTYVTMHMIED